MTDFFGSYEHSVDERGRIAVPAKFRKLFVEGAVVRAGPERCVEVYTAEGFRLETTRRLGDHLSTRDRESRRVRRAFLTNAFEVELDRQGRILVPAYLRESIGLTDNAVVVGSRDHAEIWAPAAWDTYRQALDDPQELARAFEGLGI